MQKTFKFISKSLAIATIFAAALTFVFYIENHSTQVASNSEPGGLVSPFNSEPGGL